LGLITDEETVMMLRGRLEGLESFEEFTMALEML
jgi:hypothetical protein